MTLTGCLSGPGATNASLAPDTPNIAALNGGLLAQPGGVELPASAKRQALEAEYQALQFGRVGQPLDWSADGFRGEVVPTQLYRVGSQDCRGYTHSVSRGTTTVRQIGTACRSGDMWTPV
jgi:surface antigen